MPPIDLDRLAAAEANRARRRYARQSNALAIRFEIALEADFTRAATKPLTCAPFLRGTRRSPLRKFPYAVVFVVEPTRVYVFAIPHNSQRPGYWFRRMPKP